MTYRQITTVFPKMEGANSTQAAPNLAGSFQTTWFSSTAPRLPPRLPPSRHGSDDLHLIPSHELDLLHGNQPSPISALPHSLPHDKAHSSPPFRSPRATLVTSFSELNISTFSKFRSVLQHGVQPADKGGRLDFIAPGLRSNPYPSTRASSPFLQPTRTRSQGAMTDVTVSGSLAEGTNNEDQTGNGRERPAQQAENPGADEKRNRSTSRSGKVEKRIEATLAKASLVPRQEAESRAISWVYSRKMPDKISKSSQRRHLLPWQVVGKPNKIPQGRLCLTLSPKTPRRKNEASVNNIKTGWYSLFSSSSSSSSSKTSSWIGPPMAKAGARSHKTPKEVLSKHQMI